MRVIKLARAGPGFLFFLSFCFLKKMILESSQLTISSNVAVKSHHTGVIWNKTVNK